MSYKMPPEKYEEHKANMRDRHNFFLKIGLCPQCSGKNNLIPGNHLCPDCQEKQRQYYYRTFKHAQKYRKNRYREEKDLGICVYCHKEPTLHGKSGCEACNAKRNASRREKRNAK